MQVQSGLFGVVFTTLRVCRSCSTVSNFLIFLMDHTQALAVRLGFCSVCHSTSYSAAIIRWAKKKEGKIAGGNAQG